MTTKLDENRQARLVWFVLAILGAFLTIVGWYRWAS
jgi:hypothetical protein